MALTEKYVSSSAAGGGTGLTAGSPLTFSEMVTAINAGTEVGSRFNILAGTYTRSATDTISGSGTSTSPIILRGYSTAIGDGYLGRTNGNGALIDTNIPVINYGTLFRLNVSGSWIVLESLYVKTSASAATVSLGASTAITRCKVENSGTGAGAVAVTSGTNSAVVIYNNDCLLTGASGGSAAVVCQGTSRTISNRITGGPAAGVLTRSSAAIVENTIFASAGNHISMDSNGGAPLLYKNTLVAGSSDAINIVTGSTLLQCIIGNMITDNGGYGINLVSAANGAFLANNRTRDNTSGAINLGTDWAATTSYGHITTDTGNASTDYTASGSNDYSLIAASPATSAGIPAYSSIGALQRSQTSGGGDVSHVFIG